MANNYEPMTIYRRTKENESGTYFSVKEKKPDQAKIKSLEAIQDDLDPAVVEELKRSYTKGAQDGDVVEPSYDLAQSITKRYEALNPLARESMDARVAVAVALLNREAPGLTDEDLAETSPKKKYKDALDKHLHLVRQSVDTSWRNLRGWCDEVNNKNQKTGNYLVPNDVLRALDKKVQDAKDAYDAKQKKN